MSDLDFDELDKAVNSLVGDSDAGDEKKDVTSQKPSNDEKPSDASEKIGPSLPSRRSGRFMDMKHDSSDMQKKDSSLMKPSKTTITPINPGVKKEAEDAKEAQDEAKPKSDWPDPIDSAKAVNDEESKEEPTPVSTDMPDPLDHMASNDTSNDSDKSDVKDTDKAEEKESEENDAPSEDKKDEPELDYEETDPKKDDKKDSPFIDDAKVEKRPLGGFSSESPVLPPSEVKKDEDGKSSEDSKEEKPTPEEPIELPPELDKDLVAIEAGEAIETQTPKKDEQKDPEETEKAEDKSEDQTDEKEPVEQKDRVSELLASAATGSIPEQYKRQNRSHELHAPHPLFDADHYKDSPKGTTPKKPKSLAAKIFQWIFISLGLVLLGGSLGAAAYVLLSKS